METKRTKFKLKFTKLDIIVIVSTFLLSLVLSFVVFFLPTNAENSNNLDVVVYYDQVEVTREPLTPLEGENDPRFIILFKDEITNKYDEQFPTTEKRKFGNKNLLLDDLIIKIENKKVSIVEETSPNNICSLQGDVGRVNIPLVCAPNFVTVMIESNTIDDGEVILPV